MLVDTHCHIHDEQFYKTDEERRLLYERAIEHNVRAMICIGTDLKSSRDAVAFSHVYDHAYATVGIHPHDSKDGIDGIEELLRENSGIVGVGEIGLDYHYNNSPRDVQIAALEAQIDLALRYNKPISFHVRDAFDDFWPIFDNFHGIRGVLHSFTDTQANMERGVSAGLYIGINGISTFTKDTEQQKMYNNVPIDKILLETDAPFLTPVPFRGKVNEPQFVRRVAEHRATQLQVSFDFVEKTTTANAKAVFNVQL